MKVKVLSVFSVLIQKSSKCAAAHPSSSKQVAVVSPEYCDPDIRYIAPTPVPTDMRLTGGF